MSKDPEKDKGTPPENGCSRRQFLKTAGMGNLVLGLSALGLGQVSCGQGDAVDTDTKGSLIGAVRLDPAKAYGDVPVLLEKYIKENDDASWALLKQRIDYVYDHIGYSVLPVLESGGLKERIKAEIEAGRKMFFKPNIVNAAVLDLAGDGTPGLATGVVSATNWTFLAALMRFFHDKLGIRYYQMAVGEAGVTTPTLAAIIDCTPEAVLEGCGFKRPDGKTYWAGYPFYFVRRYLAEATKALDPRDDPMSGYADSLSGTYVTPGDAARQGKLAMYELNNAERFDRGRVVLVPDGGDNYPEGITIHKALIGDPGDPGNYPGNVLVNCPVLKVHSNSVITSAIKNIGIGGWPMRAGKDPDPATHDWLYAYPHDDPPGMKGGCPGGPNKGGVYHARWYVRKVNDEGMPLEIAEVPNLGLDGTMVDISLAIRNQVPHTLHVVDAIRPINFEHGGTGAGVALDEGLVFSSEDPVAVDLFSARYLFKTVPRDPLFPSTFERPLSIPRYDAALGAIVTDKSVMDARVSRSKLFRYSAYRGLGQTYYHVSGVDVTSGDPMVLATLDGHFGRIKGGRFEDVMTCEFYYNIPKILWDLQPIVLAYAQATDALTQAALGYNPGYLEEFMALDENGDGVIDDTEAGKDGLWDCQCAGGGIMDNMMGKGMFQKASFFNPSRTLKYSNKAWNVDTSGGTGKHVESMKISADTTAFNAALNMSKGGPGTDAFFNVPYGTGADKIPKWPSLQYARYRGEMGVIHKTLYVEAKAYAEEKGQSFTLFVPDSVPYFPPASYNPDGVQSIVEISDQEFLPGGESNPKYDPEFSAKVFTAWFQGGEKW